MKIAVIGDYESQEYKQLLERVKILKCEEDVIDLSRHLRLVWHKKNEARFADIKNAHQIVICGDWDNYIDAKRDITYAQTLNKECFVEYGGQFLPFPQYARRL